jgi:hypothetical protein
MSSEVFAQPELEFRVAFPQGRQHGRQHERRDRRYHSQPQQAAHRFRGAARPFAEIFGFSQQPACALHDLAAYRRHHDRMALSFHQMRADGRFEFLYPRRQRGLRDETRLGGLGEIELFGNGNEVAQLTQRWQGGHSGRTFCEDSVGRAFESMIGNVDQQDNINPLDPSVSGVQNAIRRCDESFQANSASPDFESPSQRKE